MKIPDFLNRPYDDEPEPPRNPPEAWIIAAIYIATLIGGLIAWRCI